MALHYMDRITHVTPANYKCKSVS